MRRLVLFALACCLVTGCSDLEDIFKSKPAEKLAGKRIPVLTHNAALEADSTAHDPITLPAVDDRTAWSQSGGTATHDIGHLALAANPKLAWAVNLGVGENPRLAFTTAPIVVDNMVIAMDALGILSAYDLKSGDRLWQQDLIPLTPDDPGDGSIGGGIAFVDGRLYVSTSFAEVVAVDPKGGEPIWRHRLLTPARGAPTVAGGRVFLVTIENETVALATEDGHELWHHNGVGENTNFVGSPSPAVEGNTVVVPYTSGELFALRADTGSVEWTAMLSTVRRTDQVAELTDIKGLPVINKGRVYAIGNSDMLTAIDLRTGRSLWDREVGGLQTPWVAGDFIYLITNASELACFETATGKARWVKTLPEWVDPEDKDERITWTGPVLAGGSLIITSSEGKLQRISPLTGDVVSEEMTSDGVNIPAVVSGKTLLLVTREGILLAYR